MTIASAPHPDASPDASHSLSPTTMDARASAETFSPRVVLRGLGHALPALCRDQHETAAQLAALWRLDRNQRARWRRINESSGIEQRHAAQPIERTIGLSTAERMEAYATLAPPLAAEAADRALQDAGVDASAITDLIVVSCTGFRAPGVDVELVGRLGLPPTVRRTMIGYMGCFGGVIGLRAAVGACAAEPGSKALVVCIELCTLHLRDRPSAEDLVASALFGDAAAAAVVEADHTNGEAEVAARDSDADGSGGTRPIGRVRPGRSVLLPEGQDWMTWTITDRGFAMTLSRRVPVALGEALRGEECGLSFGQRDCFAVHPGGPEILRAIDRALDLRGGSGLGTSWEVLRTMGNVSSGTVLIILERLMHRTLRPAGPSVLHLLAFGPGLSIETLPVVRV